MISAPLCRLNVTEYVSYSDWIRLHERITVIIKSASCRKWDSESIQSAEVIIESYVQHYRRRLMSSPRIVSSLENPTM